MKQQTQANWYPSAQQLKDAPSSERTLRQVLDQFYDLQRRFDALHKQVNTPAVPEPANTAAQQRFLGLPVYPTDTTQLVDGTVLTYVKAERTFKFL